MEEGAVIVQSTATALRVSIGDLLIFINWMQQAHKAYEMGNALPGTPQVESDQVKSWIHLIHTLQERYRQSEDRQMALEAHLQAQEHEVGRLFSHLNENIASLYDNLGQSEKAQEARRRASSILAH